MSDDCLGARFEILWMTRPSSAETRCSPPWGRHTFSNTSAPIAT